MMLITHFPQFFFIIVFFFNSLSFLSFYLWSLGRMSLCIIKIRQARDIPTREGARQFFTPRNAGYLMYLNSLPEIVTSLLLSQMCILHLPHLKIKPNILTNFCSCYIVPSLNLGFILKVAPINYLTFVPCVAVMWRVKPLHPYIILITTWNSLK